MNSGHGGDADAEAARREDTDSDSDDEPNEEEIPFACFICREKFNKNPVVTLCSHYFCYDCISAQCKKGNSRCPVCNKNTEGVFNRAVKILKRLSVEKAALGAPVVPTPKKVSTWEVVKD